MCYTLYKSLMRAVMTWLPQTSIKVIEVSLFSKGFLSINRFYSSFALSSGFLLTMERYLFLVTSKFSQNINLICSFTLGNSVFYDCL